MAPFVASWGILGCGWISSEFCRDLALGLDTTQDVVHSIEAVGSRGQKKAEEFIEKHCPQGGTAQSLDIVTRKPQAFGSYKEVIDHPDVDIIYIGTVHTAHYVDSRAAIDAGKHVLVEKPACLNSHEWDDLTNRAIAKGVLLMEGVWTRFQPLALLLQKKLFEEKVIGDIRMVRADFSIPFYKKLSAPDRLFNPEVAGGALFDTGPYPILAALLTLYENPKNAREPPVDIRGSIIRGETGVDIITNISLSFPRLEAMASLSTSIAYSDPADEKCVISGTDGEIAINSGIPRLKKMTIKTIVDSRLDRQIIEEQGEFSGFGLVWEADGFARAVRDGLKEHPLMTHGSTRMELEIMDAVRTQCQYYLAPGLERIQPILMS